LSNESVSSGSNFSAVADVPVSASIQMMPASAPGNAIMMMNGSTQDWNSITSSA